MAMSRGFVAVSVFLKRKSHHWCMNAKELLRKALEGKQVRLNQKAALHPHL